MPLFYKKYETSLTDTFPGHPYVLNTCVYYMCLGLNLGMAYRDAVPVEVSDFDAVKNDIAQATQDLAAIQETGSKADIYKQAFGCFAKGDFYHKALTDLDDNKALFKAPDKAQGQKVAYDAYGLRDLASNSVGFPARIKIGRQISKILRDPFPSKYRM